MRNVYIRIPINQESIKLKKFKQNMSAKEKKKITNMFCYTGYYSKKVITFLTGNQIETLSAVIQERKQASIKYVVKVVVNMLGQSKDPEHSPGSDKEDENCIDCYQYVFI